MNVNLPGFLGTRVEKNILVDFDDDDENDVDDDVECAKETLLSNMRFFKNDLKREFSFGG